MLGTLQLFRYDENRGITPNDQELLFTHLNDNSTHVITAFRAHGMSWNYSAALGAHLQLTRLFSVVRSTHA